MLHFDGLVQEKCNSSVLAIELHLSCTNPSICSGIFIQSRQLELELELENDLLV